MTNMTSFVHLFVGYVDVCVQSSVFGATRAKRMMPSGPGHAVRVPRNSAYSLVANAHAIVRLARRVDNENDAGAAVEEIYEKIIAINALQ